MTFHKEFIQQSIVRLNENTPRIIRCLNEISEEEVWCRPNENSNSIGNLVLHLCGNIRQYIISGLGESQDTRERSTEFSLLKRCNKKELIELLKNTLEHSIGIITELSPTKLLGRKTIQNFDLSGIGIIIHVVEHYSFHTGQITYYTKSLRNIDLKYYDDSKL